MHAGTVNITTPIEVEATATDEGTLIAEIARLMQAAEQGRGRYVRLADRAARIYAPAVHILGAVTFIGWMLAGAGWEQALTYAIAVLIITCPCALALAVPAVQVAATGRLFAKGVIVKAPDALERLAETDTVVLDKTGTLTLGEPRLIDAERHRRERAGAGRVAGRRTAATPTPRRSSAARRRAGLRRRARGDVREMAGCGLAAETPAARSGSARPQWVGVGDAGRDPAPRCGSARATQAPVPFRFEDALRRDAREVVAALKRAGYAVELALGRPRRKPWQRPPPRLRHRHLARRRAPRRQDRPHRRARAPQGRKVLMIGDGLNDAPALAAGHASLSPSSAADISQTAADAIFQGERLAPDPGDDRGRAPRARHVAAELRHRARLQRAVRAARHGRASSRR